ncbi:PQQ-dependent sugar dehydrogenase [Teredinibacter turnerae]|uniref:PQQ-dependent sugar dehydrogenase n=1 Tax=Teredinibacter turnerae TaxID=2426 RepID=UPI0005F8414E|nr:PQQ-dependent sugar dehydrogenase [Teredinibacter turnerae]
MRIWLALVLTTLFSFTHAAPSQPPASPSLKLTYCQQVRGGITDIEFIDAGQALITEKGGRLYFFSGCDKPATEVTRLSVDVRSELGLLGVAIAPGREYVYLYYAPKGGSEVITRLSAFEYSRKAGVPVLGKEKVLLEIEQPYNNHDGGSLKFGPDGNLYLGVGDGGSAGDPLDAGQNESLLLGSILRIAPAPKTKAGYKIPAGNLISFKPKAAPEILAMGLRNPWKMSFDSRGNLIVADVGQNLYEEISIIPHSAIGKKPLNLGWRLREAAHCFNPKKDCMKPDLLEPVYEYDRSFGASITGGETVKLNDREFYTFADFASGKIGVLDLAAPDALFLSDASSSKHWTTFGKSDSGELYIADIEGNIYRLSLDF